MDKIRESGTGNDKDFYVLTYTRNWIDWEDPNKEHLASCEESQFTHKISRNLGEWLIMSIDEDFLCSETCTFRDFDTCRGIHQWLEV